MAQQEIPLKCRAICSDCKKPFDLRSGGGLHNGRRICGECYSKLKFRTIAPDYQKRRKKIDW